MSNIIDKIQVSGVTYDIGGTGGGGNPTVELTQAEYDALVTAGTVSADTYYIITDAQAGDLTNYYTKTETNTLLGGKQATLVSGTNIKTINNESILGSGNIDIQGGGKAIEAGRGIEIATGETADTVSFNLPISANTNNSIVMGGKITNSFTNNGRDCLMVGSNLTTNNGSDCSLVVGYRSSVNGDGSAVIGWDSKSVGDSAFAFGTSITATTSYTFATGYSTKANNQYEHTSGKYNVSNTGSTEADKTLFSVGNGTADSARHNAFEIRQNGDIYLSSGGTDIKLQDHLGSGGGGKAVTGGTNISVTTGTTTDTINCTLPIREGSNSSGKGIIVGDSECTASGLYAISLGHSSDANGEYSFCNGSNSQANGQMSFAYGDGCSAKHSYTFMFGWTNESTKAHQYSFGSNVKPKNQLEFGFGTYNNSSSASTTFGHSGNTMFSIGNGYDFSSTHNHHNALEVRQNGDIYVPNTDDTSVTGDYAYSLYPMVRLQDTITATAVNTTALGGLKLVKLSQSEYDSLSTKDNSTLYVIVN